MGLCLPFIDRRNANRMTGALSQSALSGRQLLEYLHSVQQRNDMSRHDWFVQIFDWFHSVLCIPQLSFDSRDSRYSSQMENVDICTAPRPQSEHINKSLYVRFELFDSEILGKVLRAIEMAD